MDAVITSILDKAIDGLKNYKANINENLNVKITEAKKAEEENTIAGFEQDTGNKCQLLVNKRIEKYNEDVRLLNEKHNNELADLLADKNKDVQELETSRDHKIQVFRETKYGEIEATLQAECASKIRAIDNEVTALEKRKEN